MTKRKLNFAKIFVVTLFVAVLSLALAACGPKGVSVNWDIDENATVTVDGYEGLPEKVVEDTVTFSVTPKTGYVIDAVSVATTDNPTGQSLKARDGKYTTDVVEGMTVKVTVKTELDHITVTHANPLNYHAGDSVNKADIVVKAVYKNNSEVTIADKDYRIKYQDELSEAFALGDTSFTVTYQGKTSDAVTLAKAVTGLITLDTAGGSISAEDITRLQTENGLTFTKSGDVYTAEFSEPLVTSILLPVNTTKDGCTLWKWTVGDNPAMVANITASEDAPIEESAVATAHWSYNLINLTSATLETGDDGISLKIAGTYTAAMTDVHLAFAFAGKTDDVAYIDEAAYTGTASGAAAITFKVDNLLDKFASDGTRYTGSTLVLQLRATVNGEKRIQLLPYDEESFTESSMVAMAEWNVQLTHDAADSYAHSLVLKFPSQNVVLTYTVSGEETNEGVVLKIEGQITVERFFGKSVYIWWSMGSKFGNSVPIDQQGKFTWTAVLSAENGYKDLNIGWAHLNIHEPDASISPDDLSNSLYSYASNGNFFMGEGPGKGQDITVCKNAISEFTFTNTEIKAMKNAGDFPEKSNSATTTSIKYAKPLNTKGDIIYYVGFYKTGSTDCLVLMSVPKDVATQYDLA